ncbi:MAG: transglutaminase family protein, partial [Lachnospiraceae bacterium]|nr:transglutaminase family protein [Lachnospiraceae bacterium]
APVVNVPVSDATGHAWVEIWFPELGWVPFEFTVGINGDADEEGDFEFWNGTGILDDIDFSPVAGLFQVDLSYAAKLLGRLLLIVAVGIVIVLIVRFILLLLRKQQKPELYHSGRNLQLLKRYREICSKYAFFGLLPKENLLYADFTKTLKDQYDFSEEKSDSLKKFLENAAYGPEEVPETIYEETNVLLTDAQQRFENTLTLKQKLLCRLRSLRRKKA